jgi:pyridinium-3,5-bisthiocarboxylic acid mononucleotide nickel chelatase
MYDAQRRVIARSFRQVETAFGSVQMKEGENGTFAPEYEDCRRLALERNVPLRTVMAEATRSFLRSTSNSL